MSLDVWTHVLFDICVNLQLILLSHYLLIIIIKFLNVQSEKVALFSYWH